jgi:peptide/nickel transport system substrate-binding protein
MVQHATAFKEGAAPGGVNVKIVQSPEDSYWSDVWLKKPFTCVQWNGRPDDQALSIVYLSDAPWNESHYKSDKLDGMIKGARGQSDADRKQTYADVQKLLIDTAIRPIPVHLPVTVGLRDRVGGIQAHPGNWLLVYDAYLKDA